MIGKSIQGFENYTVYPDGRIYSKKSRKILSQNLDGNGYLKINLHSKGKSKTKKVHRIVAETFLNNINDKPCINHKDGIKTNNDVSNLEWCTYSENTIHAYDNNLKKPVKGNQYTIENPKNLKLTSNQIKEILFKKDSYSQRDLSKQYNVSQTLISRIINKKHRNYGIMVN